MKRTLVDDGQGSQKKRRVGFAANKELAQDLVPDQVKKREAAAARSAQASAASAAMRAAAPLSTDPGLGSVLAGIGGATSGAEGGVETGTNVVVAPVASVLSNDELIDMEKTGDLGVLKRYKQTQADDMARLAHLDSAKSRIYEKEWDKSRKKDELDDIFGDEDEDGDAEMGEGRQEDVEEEEEVEDFDTREEEKLEFFSDNNRIGQFREERKEERKQAVKDHWYFEHMQKKEAEENDGERAIERLQQRRPRASEEKREDPVRKRYGDAPDVDLFRALLSHLSEGETVAAAIRRLGNTGASKRTWKSRGRQKAKAAAAGGPPSEDDKKEQAARLAQMEAATTLAELCMERGFASIYSRSRAWLLREVGRLTGVSGGNTQAEADRMWEYQAADGSGGVFGPYTAAQLLEWQQAGYFSETSPLAVRPVGDEEWVSSSTVDFAALAAK